LQRRIDAAAEAKETASRPVPRSTRSR